MDVVLLGAALLGALLLIPLGLPGTWAMVGAAFVYDFAQQSGGVGGITIGGTAALALIAEFIELFLAAHYSRRYGGSRRAGWGAVIGGLVGVFVGVPVPVVGPVIGGLVGAFGGAFVGEFEHAGNHRVAARVAYGALLGRVAASAMKVAIGVAIAVWIMVAATT